MLLCVLLDTCRFKATMETMELKSKLKEAYAEVILPSKLHFSRCVYKTK